MQQPTRGILVPEYSGFEWSQIVPEIRGEVVAHMDIQQLKTLEDALVGSVHDLEPAEEIYHRTRAVITSFSLDADLLLHLFEKHGAVMAGSCALLILLDTALPQIAPNDIDFVVNFRNASHFVDDLVANSRYQRQTDPPKSPEAGVGAIEYYGFTRGILKSYYLVDAVSGKKICIVETRWDPSLSIFAFHSSAAMNIIFHWGVLCGYGELTCHRISIINTLACSEGSHRVLMAGVRNILEKWEKRGISMAWDISDGPLQTRYPSIQNHECGSWAYCPHTQRNTDDEGMIRMVFPSWKKRDIEIMRVNWKLASGCNCVTWREARFGNSCTQEGFVVSVN